jgi:hypothetical protein
VQYTVYALSCFVGYLCGPLGKRKFFADIFWRREFPDFFDTEVVSVVQHPDNYSWVP